VLRLWVAPSGRHGDALEVRALKRRGPPLIEPLHLAARPARLSRLLAAQEYALDRTAACV
jgi:protein ImuA